MELLHYGDEAEKWTGINLNLENDLSADIMVVIHAIKIHWQFAK